jgi:hypothetical protein
MAESFGAKKKRRVLLQGSDDRENKETQLASRRRKFLRANRPTDRSTYRPTDRPTYRPRKNNKTYRAGRVQEMSMPPSAPAATELPSGDQRTQLMDSSWPVSV